MAFYFYLFTGLPHEVYLPMSHTHYPIIIVGGGPIGLACAIEAKKAGLDYLVIEKGPLVNSLYNYPANMTFFSTSERLEIGDVPFVSNNPKPTRSEALEYYRRVAISYQLNIHLFEEVKEIRREDAGCLILDTGSPEENTQNGSVSSSSSIQYQASSIQLPAPFLVSTTKSSYSADHIIISTGFYDIPFLLDVPGEDLPKVTHYYKDPHFYAFQKVLVVGSQNSAVDAALETWRKGAEVTMVIRGAEIGQRVKYWVRPDIINRIKEGEIKAYFNSSVKAIREEAVDIRTPEGPVTIANDWVLALTGYQPNLDFLRRMGVELSEDEVRCPVLNNDTQETSVRNLFLAGVICGGMNTNRLFIENSREHAVKIMRAIRERRTGKSNTWHPASI